MAFSLFKTLEVIANIGILAGGAASICNSVSSQKSSYQIDSYEQSRIRDQERNLRRLEKRLDEISDVEELRSKVRSLDPDRLRILTNRLKHSYDNEVKQLNTSEYSQPLCCNTQAPVQYASVPGVQSSCTPAYSYSQPYNYPVQAPAQYAQAPVIQPTCTSVYSYSQPCSYPTQAPVQYTQPQVVQPGQMIIQQTAGGQTVTMNMNDFITAIIKAVAIAMNNQFSQATGSNGIS